MSTFLSKAVVVWCAKRYPGINVCDVIDMYNSGYVDGSDASKWLRGHDDALLPGLWRDGRLHRHVANEIKKLVAVLVALPGHTSRCIVAELIRERNVDSAHIHTGLINHLFVSIKKSMPSTDVRGLLCVQLNQ